MTAEADPAGRIAIVTGASSGIGRAIALGLAGDGVVLGLVGRRLDALRAVATDCSARGARPQCFVADLARPEECGRLGDRIAGDFGSVDVLIQSAGILEGEPYDSPTEARARVLQVNVHAVEQLTESLLPSLRVRRGQVVIINSSAGLPGRPIIDPYTESKQELRAVADRLRTRLNPEGIRVLSVYPGRTATPMQAAVRVGEGLPYTPERLLQPGDIAVMVLQALALPKTAEVTDLSIRPLLQS